MAQYAYKGMDFFFKFSLDDAQKLSNITFNSFNIFVLHIRLPLPDIYL